MNVSFLVAVVFIAMGTLPIGDADAADAREKGQIQKASGTSITKSQALALLVQSAESDNEINSDPFKKETLTCLYGKMLDEIFKGSTSLDVQTFGTRLSSIATTTKWNTDSPEFKLLAVKCMVNSHALETAITERDEVRKETVRSLDLDDLRVDMATLNGKKVRVRGVGFYMMDMFMLKKSMTDMSPMFVDTSKLVREQRKEIISRCGDMMTGCNLIVHGTVGKVSYQNGLLAEQVEFR